MKKFGGVVVAMVMAATVSIAAWASDADDDRTQLPAETQLRDAHCGDKVLATLEKWEAKRDWTQAPPTLDGARLYRSPTQKIGVWLELVFAPDGTVSANRVSAEAWTQANWSASDCVPKIAVTPHKYDKKRMDKSFTDADLEKVVTENKAGLIYAWSPHMPLSVRGYESARKAAEKARVKFVPVVDPAAEGRSIASESTKAKMSTEAKRPIESLDLILRGMMMHFPSALVFSNGRITSKLLPGLEAEVGYTNFIKENTR